MGVGAFVAGICVGVFISGPPTHSPSQSSSAARSNDSSVTTDNRIVGKEDSAAAALTATSTDSADVLEKFWTTLTIGDDRERQAAWFALLSNLNSGNAAEVRELFRKMDAQGRWFVPEWDAFWLRWGEVDGRAALEQVPTTGNAEYQPMLAEKILKGWAAKDPAGARNWLTANPSSPLYLGALKGYLTGLARTDLDRATQDALALGKDHEIDGISEVLTEQALKQRQLAGMLDWWRSLPEDTGESSLRRQAIGDIYQRLQAANDPRTGDWLTELAGTPFRPENEIGEHAAKIAATDPAAAISWVASLPPSADEGHYTGIGRTVRALAAKDPVAVENWLGKLPASPFRDQAYVAYATFLERATKPEEAQRWRSQVQDQKLLQRGEATGTVNRVIQTLRLNGGSVQTP